jgi:adenine specific DNA methylase Mod
VTELIKSVRESPTGIRNLDEKRTSYILQAKDKRKERLTEFRNSLVGKERVKVPKHSTSDKRYSQMNMEQAQTSRNIF